MPSGQGQMLIVPAVVCLAFSIETGIKALLEWQGIDARGHDLQSLFRQLADETRETIASNLGMSDNDAAFIDEMKKVSKAFVEWRYIHELDSANLNLDFLRKLASSVNAVIRTSIN